MFSRLTRLATVPTAAVRLGSPMRFINTSPIIRANASPVTLNGTNSTATATTTTTTVTTATTNADFSKVGNPQKKTERKNERIVLWKLYATFHRHNTLTTMVAVVEDLDFLEKNPDLSYNEKVIYYLQLPHHPKLHISAGQLGFRKSQRQEYEAGFQVASKMFKTIEEKNMIGPNDKIELILKDFGKGREAFLAALQGKEGTHIRPNIVRISDNTKLRFGGSRPKKLRRL